MMTRFIPVACGKSAFQTPSTASGGRGTCEDTRAGVGSLSAVVRILGWLLLVLWPHRPSRPPPSRRTWHRFQAAGPRIKTRPINKRNKPLPVTGPSSPRPLLRVLVACGNWARPWQTGDFVVLMVVVVGVVPPPPQNVDRSRSRSRGLSFPNIASPFSFPPLPFRPSLIRLHLHRSDAACHSSRPSMPKGTYHAITPILLRYMPRNIQAAPLTLLPPRLGCPLEATTCLARGLPYLLEIHGHIVSSPMAAYRHGSSRYKGAVGHVTYPPHKEMGYLPPIPSHTRTHAHIHRTQAYPPVHYTLYIPSWPAPSHPLLFPRVFLIPPFFGYSPCLTFFISPSPYTLPVVLSHNGDRSLLFAHSTGLDHQD